MTLTDVSTNNITNKLTNYISTGVFIVSTDVTQITWLWRWLPLRLSKRQSMSSQTVLLRTTLTRTIVLYFMTHILETIALLELYITVLGERRTFLSNRCINEMHYTYGIGRRQVCHVSSPWLCCKTRLLQDDTLCVHFLSFKENWSYSADTLHSLACMIICWNEKEKQLWSFQHPNLPRVTNHKQNAVEKLKHT